MDLTQPVEYRRFSLNDAVRLTTGGPISGCALERVNYSNVPAVGYTEKRSLSDGFDSGDVFLGMRRIQLQGTLYGISPGELFDKKQDLVAALSPTLAYAEYPQNYGYLPLDWWEPTADTRFDTPYPTPFLRHVYCNVRPTALPQFEIIRDRLGQPKPHEGLSLQWQAMVEAKDPRIYLDPAIYTYFYPMSNTSGSGTFVNRGDYPAPLQALLEITAHADQRYWHFTGGGTVLTISLPPTTVTQVFRYDGYLKVLTVTENSKEYLRMDLLDTTAEITHPLIKPGTTTWSWTRNTTAGTFMVKGGKAAPKSQSQPVMVAEIQNADPANRSIALPPTHPDNSSRFWFSEAFA